MSKDIGRYIRQEAMPDFAGKTQVLRGKTVGITGCGGLGGLCAVLLAGAGVGHIRIADGDCVEVHNLHRQIMYGMAEVGQNKALCLQQRIEALNPEVQVDAIPQYVKTETFAEFAEGLDLYLDMTDSREARLVLSRLALQHHLPFLHVAVTGYTGILCPFFFNDAGFVKKYGCYDCLNSAGLAVAEPEHTDSEKQELMKKGITGPAAAFMSAAAASVALQILAGNLTVHSPEAGRLKVFDLKNLSSRSFQLTRNEDCTVCREVLQETETAQ